MKVPSFSTPRTLYITRIAQLLFTIGFLILICWCGTHRSWWNNINGALAVGVITSIFTLLLTAHALLTPHLPSSRNPFADVRTRTLLLRLTADLIVLLLWVASATLMLRPKGGCDLDRDQAGHDRIDGAKLCWTKAPPAPSAEDDVSGEGWVIKSGQPLREWDGGIAIAFVEIVAFALTTFLVWRDERSRRGSSGGTSSYA